MLNESYTREIVVKSCPETAFRAITNEVEQWWGSVSNGVHKEGDIFTKFFDPTWWTFCVTHYEQNAAIDMKCIEAHHIVKGLPDTIREEWIDTTLCWRIEAVDDGTRISLTHEGLGQELHCYEVCVSGWDHFFVGSLQRYLNEGISLHQG